AGVDRDAVALAGRAFAAQLDARPEIGAVRVRLDREVEAARLADRVAQGLRARELGVARALGERDRRPGAQAQRAAPRRGALRGGEQRREHRAPRVRARSPAPPGRKELRPGRLIARRAMGGVAAPGAVDNAVGSALYSSMEGSKRRASTRMRG